ncbi:hypothetical protein [Marinactinospora rubrisoli]|uniref:RapZ C-terminal domain-containing protein n=1 Tax=Marinactinospora rubrisoli TaxID=2715399 RepID=A0ABW2KPW5_9ACTN
MRAVEILSFGYIYAPPPRGMHFVADLRDFYAEDALPGGTGLDRPVRDAIMNLPGARELTASLTQVASAYLATAGPGPVRIALGSTNGRHRAPGIAIAMHDALLAHARIDLTHRDLHRAFE